MARLNYASSSSEPALCTAQCSPPSGDCSANISHITSHEIHDHQRVLLGRAAARVGREAALILRMRPGRRPFWIPWPCRGAARRPTCLFFRHSGLRPIRSRLSSLLRLSRKNSRNSRRRSLLSVRPLLWRTGCIRNSGPPRKKGKQLGLLALFDTERPRYVQLMPIISVAAYPLTTFSIGFGKYGRQHFQGAF